jgi:hypothetical protein
MNTPALDKFLTHHLRTCTWHIYSGDRHCSCGMEAARRELEQLKADAERPVPLQLFTFVEKERITK